MSHDHDHSHGGGLASLEGVVDGHGVHVGTVTSEMEAARARVLLAVGTDTRRVLDQARTISQTHHHVARATLQVEPSDHTGCEEVGW